MAQLTIGFYDARLVTLITGFFLDRVKVTDKIGGLPVFVAEIGLVVRGLIELVAGLAGRLWPEKFEVWRVRIWSVWPLCGATKFPLRRLAIAACR